jgi:hypothetical protein
MVALVTQMLDLNKKLQDARLEQEKTMLSRQIEAMRACVELWELIGQQDRSPTKFPEGKCWW